MRDNQVKDNALNKPPDTDPPTEIGQKTGGGSDDKDASRTTMPPKPAHVLFRVDATKINFDEDGEEDFPNLGALLVYLRKRLAMHMARLYPGSGEPRVSAAAIVKALNDHGYPMTTGSYSLLEQGKSLPRTPDLFLLAVAQCLGIEPTSKYWTLMRWQYVYDFSVRYFGEAAADMPHGSTGLAELRRKADAGEIENSFSRA